MMGILLALGRIIPSLSRPSANGRKKRPAIAFSGVDLSSEFGQITGRILSDRIQTAELSKSSPPRVSCKEVLDAVEAV